MPILTIVTDWSIIPFMARTPSITDEQILEAALQVFLEQGFNAPATEIATRAGISSGSIFKRYPTKEDLFFAAMNCESRWAGGLSSLVGQGDLKVNLEAISNAVLSFAREMLPRSMLSWSLRHCANRNKGQEPSVGRDIRLLSEFLQAERELGRLRPSLDPQVTATTLVGTIMSYGMLEVISGRQNDDPEEFIKTFIDTLWKGLISSPESF
jgi:AcrR family transcriptional regulator